LDSGLHVFSSFIYLFVFFFEQNRNPHILAVMARRYSADTDTGICCLSDDLARRTTLFIKQAL
jgi:hypothetical protein